MKEPRKNSKWFTSKQKRMTAKKESRSEFFRGSGADGVRRDARALASKNKEMREALEGAIAMIAAMQEQLLQLDPHVFDYEEDQIVVDTITNWQRLLGAEDQS